MQVCQSAVGEELRSVGGDVHDTLAKFTRAFNEFADDMLRTFPNDMEFYTYHCMIKGISAICPEKLLKNFKSHVEIPYGTRILNSDESFFLSQKYEQVQGQNGVELVGKLKRCWQYLNTADREVVWRYLKLLVRLSKRT